MLAGKLTPDNAGTFKNAQKCLTVEKKLVVCWWKSPLLFLKNVDEKFFVNFTQSKFQ